MLFRRVHNETQSESISLQTNATLIAVHIRYTSIAPRMMSMQVVQVCVYVTMLNYAWNYNYHNGMSSELFLWHVATLISKILY